MSPPLVTVVVPARDRPESLASCLEALAAQRFPRDRFEVLVVDDRSRTPLGPVVDRYRDRMRVDLLRGQGMGPAAARNLGAEEARGEFLAFTDDDCAPWPDWLATLAHRFESDPRSGVGGRVVNRLERNSYSAASQALIDYLSGYYNEPGDTGRFFVTSNLALPRSGFREIGGFVPDFEFPGGEDRELCDRWIRSGRRILWVPEATVDHAHPLTLRSFWRQHLRYGRGARRFHELRAAAGEPPPPVEPPSFYAGLLLHPFRARLRAPIRTLFLLGLSQLATAAGYFLEWARSSGHEPG